MEPEDQPTRDGALTSYPILFYFRYDHLKEPLRAMSAQFSALAWAVALTPSGDEAETNAALRKLLEAKDAAVRALLNRRS